MAAPVQPERFLFERQLLDFGPGRRLGQAAARGLLDVVSAAKQLRLPFVPIALKAGPVLARDVDGRHQPRSHFARMARDAAGQGIERAGLRQALEDALVEEPQVEILAQRLERRDRALRLSHGEQRLNRAFADVLDRGQPEADTRRR